MEDFERDKADAARWLHQRRERVDWWRWSVLTAHNSRDPETLKLSDQTAFLIFADLVQRGLLVPTVDDKGNDAFAINPGRETEWQQIMHPTYHAAKAAGWRVGEWLVTGVIGAILGAIATAIAM